jgi:uncharacterized protein (DUF2336 family)
MLCQQMCVNSRRTGTDARVQHMDDRFLTQVEELAALGRAQELEFDGVVARVAVDQFTTLLRPTQVDVDRLTAVLLDAMPRIDPDFALRIAEKLATNALIPEVVLSGLVERGAAAAACIFKNAPRLSTALLLRRAERGDCVEATAIAMRPDLDKPVVAVLARRTEPEPLRALAVNDAAHIEPGALPGMVQRGRFDAQLARALLRRPELGLRALPLFLWADPETRRNLIAATQRAELQNAVHASSPLEATRQNAISAARAANRAGFATAIALALRTGRATIERMIDDEGGEPLALIFAATGAPAAISADALAMLHPARFSTISHDVHLALETSAAASARIVVAAANGRVAHVRSAEEYAPSARTQSLDVIARVPTLTQMTKLSRA